MDKSLSQITFEFFGEQQEEQKEFLSGQPVPPAKPVKTRGRKPLKDFEADIEQVEVPEDEILFQLSIAVPQGFGCESIPAIS